MFKNLSYSLKQSCKQIGRNRGMCFTAFISIASMLILVGLFFILTVNVNVATESIKGQFNTIEVFLLDSTKKSEATAMSGKIEEFQGVEAVEYIPKSQALEEFKKRFGNNSYLLDGLAENPLPNGLRVTLSNLEYGDYVAEKCSEIPGVEDIRYYKSEVAKILKVSEGIQRSALIIIAFLVFISIIVVSNTIKLTVMARQEEITIQKFIGATNWFIRGPFLWEGILIGLFSAIAALGISAFLYSQFIVKIGPQLALLVSMEPVELGFIVENLAWIFSAFGIAIGAFGSLVSMRRFLKV